MAFRIEKSLVRGEISNEERGVVTGKVWLAGRKDPLLLRLQGNCLRDLAGCRLSFRNPRPESEPHLHALSNEQNGLVGDMTASRKVKVAPDAETGLPDPADRRPDVPIRLANCLYLEWYSEEDGRVVIESVGCHLEISAPAWSMDEEDELKQLESSRHHFQQFLESITGDAGDTGEEIAAPESPLHDPTEAADPSAEAEGPAEEELDEFEWEQELREADRRAEAYQEAYEKYKDHPDCERLIAEALGWDDGTADENAEIFEVDEEELNAWNEAAEEVDGLRHHPLSQRAMDFALIIQREAEERGLLAEGSALRESPILSLILHVISLGGKLAGALDGWAHGLDREPGFVIAMLKRAQVPLNEALNAFEAIRPDPCSHETRLWLHSRKRDLFDIRKDIIDLMHELRAGP